LVIKVLFGKMETDQRGQSLVRERNASGRRRMEANKSDRKTPDVERASKFVTVV
jgi:hypothetical protein